MKEKIKDSIIAFAFILLIGFLMVVIFKYVGENPSQNDCAGQNAQDCVEGNGSWHPLWND